MYSLEAIAHAKADQTEIFFEYQKNRVSTLANHLKSSTTPLSGQALPTHDTACIITTSGHILFSNHPDFPEGKVLTDPDGSGFASARQEVTFSTALKEGRDYFTFGIAPISPDSLLVVKIKLNPLYRQFAKVQGLGKTGEILLVKKTNPPNAYSCLARCAMSRMLPSKFFLPMTLKYGA